MIALLLAAALVGPPEPTPQATLLSAQLCIYGERLVSCADRDQRICFSESGRRVECDRLQFWGVLATQSSGAFLDGLSTLECMSTPGCEEVNPLIKSEDHLLLYKGMEAVAFSAGVMLVQDLWNAKAARWLNRFLFAFRALIAGWNLNQIHKANQAQPVPSPVPLVPYAR